LAFDNVRLEIKNYTINVQTQIQGKLEKKKKKKNRTSKGKCLIQYGPYLNKRRKKKNGSQLIITKD